MRSVSTSTGDAASRLTSTVRPNGSTGWWTGSWTRTETALQTRLLEWSLLRHGRWRRQCLTTNAVDASNIQELVSTDGPVVARDGCDDRCLLVYGCNRLRRQLVGSDRSQHRTPHGTERFRLRPGIRADCEALPALDRPDPARAGTV